MRYRFPDPQLPQGDAIVGEYLGAVLRVHVFRVSGTSRCVQLDDDELHRHRIEPI